MYKILVFGMKITEAEWWELKSIVNHSISCMDLI